MENIKCLFFVLFLCLLSLDLQADNGCSLNYGIATINETYVLGEPVVVSVFVSNGTPRPKLVPVDSLKYQYFGIQISSYGTVFTDVSLGYGGTLNISPMNRVLSPGATQYYPFRILRGHYHLKSKASLVFSEPGVYFIRCRIGSTSPRFTSAIKIKVLAPQGLNRQVWKRLNRPELLHFLQFADLAPSRSQEALQLVEIIRQFPGSAYEDDILWAVRHHFCWRIEEVAHPLWPQEAMFRKVLGLPPVGLADWGLRDRRLDCQQVVLSSGLNTLRNLLLHASMQTGVTLGLSHHGGLPSRPIRVHRRVMSLRQLMQAVAEPGQTMWVRHGDGYRLELVPAGKK